MKKLLFLSIFTALINSAEVDWKNTEISFQDLSQSISPTNSLIDLSARAVVNSFSLKDALEKMPADDLKHVIVNHWYQLNKDKLSKIASQKYRITPEHTLNGHTRSISSIAISGDKVITGSWDNSAIIWDLNTGTRLHTLNGHTSWIRSVAISGDKVVTGSNDRAIIWDLNTGAKLYTLSGHTGSIFSVAISGDKVVTGSNDESAIIWDLDTGARLHTLNGHTSWISSVAISDDKVVTGSCDRSAIIWDLNTGEKLHTLRDHSASLLSAVIYLDDNIRSVTISGDKIVTRSDDGNAIIWDLNTGKKLHTLKGHTHKITSVAISGDKVVTGSNDYKTESNDKTAIIWDLNTGAKLYTLNGHTKSISSVAISGDKLVTGSCDGSTIIWDLNQPITQLLSDETGLITFDSLIETDKKLQALQSTCTLL